jgi:chaperonin cofactor prefoldin
MAGFSTKEEKREQLEVENDFLRYKVAVLRKQNENLKRQIEGLLKGKKVKLLEF